VAHHCQPTQVNTTQHALLANGVDLMHRCRTPCRDPTQTNTKATVQAHMTGVSNHTKHRCLDPRVPDSTSDCYTLNMFQLMQQHSAIVSRRRHGHFRSSKQSPRRNSAGCCCCYHF